MARGRSGDKVELVLFALAVLAFLAGYGRRAEGEQGFEPVQREAGVLRVVTWNVGESLEQGGSGLRDESLAHVAATLAELAPDLVFLQELEDRAQLRRLRDDLAATLGGQWSEQECRVSGGRRIGTLGRNLPLEFVRRGPCMLVVAYGATQEDALIVAGVHADAFSARERNDAIGEAVNLLFSIGEDLPCILLGDLNLDLDLDKRRDLFSDDAYLDVETYNYVAERLVDAARGRGATAEPDRRLDYIFVSNSHFEVIAAGPWKGRRIGAMDHDPVVADLRPRN